LQPPTPLHDNLGNWLWQSAISASLNRLAFNFWKLWPDVDTG
jgi:hypothetical protein